jgi:hypothetical protein
MRVKKGIFFPLRRLLVRNGSPNGHITKRLRQMADNPRRKSMPVFLMGNTRSGTSMVVFHLERSTAVDLYNENHPRAFRDFHLQKIEKIAQLVERSYARVVLFKPVLDTHLSRVLLERFPGAKIIFMFRHYDDVINSARIRFFEKPVQAGKARYEDLIPPVDRWLADDFAEFALAPPSPALKAELRALHRPDLNLESKIALHWILFNRLYFDLELHTHPRVITIQYETIVCQPAPIMRSICDFIGIRFEEKLMKDVHGNSIRKQEPPTLDPAIRAACNSIWMQLLAANPAATGV